MSAFSVSKFDLKHLRIFISVVENEGVSATALANNVALSTISRDLTALEDRLGMQLCRRGRGGFALTHQGEKIYRAAVNLQSHLHLFELEVQAAKSSISGSFNIGIIDHVITNHGSGLVSAMANIRKEFPEISINVTVHEISSIDVLVRERRLDIGVTGLPTWLNPLEYVPVFEEEHRMYVSSSCNQFDNIHKSMANPSSPAATPVPYIARVQKSEVFGAFEERYPHEIMGRYNNLESVLAAVLSGSGCALMPVKFVESLKREELVEVPFEESPVQVQFYLSYRRDSAKQQDIKSFLSQFS